MDRQSFFKYLNSPQETEAKHLPFLIDTITAYPYFQSTRVLLLKAYKVADSFQFNKELSATAIQSPDRTRLQELLIDKAFTPSENINKQDISTDQKEAKNLHLEQNILAEAIHSSIEQDVSKIFSPENSDSNQSIDHLIEKFINDTPQITPKRAEFFSPMDLAKSSLTDDQSVVSETLADIYSTQGAYEKAINVYQQLILTIPEKKAYFADRISEIEKIITKKN